MIRRVGEFKKERLKPSEPPSQLNFYARQFF
nr:MAG TPA: hypothetical protein [Caudoviricetes sp.]